MHHLLTTGVQVHVLLFGATATVNLGFDDNGAAIHKEKELIVDRNEFSSMWWISVRFYGFQ